MSTSASVKPYILLLSLDDSLPFDQMYERLLEKLSAVATLAHANKPDSALRSLADQPPHAVLVTDPSITHHGDVHAAVFDYVRAGGTVILMGNLSSLVRPKDLDSLFQRIGLPWTYADYVRTTVYLNTLTGASQLTSLPSCYSQKAVFLANVRVEAAWYLPSDASRTESDVFRSERIQNLQQTPVAFTSMGKGKLGYVGDVNGEEGSDAVVLAMCGLQHVL